MNIQNFEHTKFEIMVERHDNQAITTSLKVAQFFGKQHKDVLKRIRGLGCSPEFNERNFAPVEYLDQKGERRPAYEMTKDGFVLLVMGFSGSKAMRIKEAYINAFNWMADQLQQEVFSISAELNAVTLAYQKAETKASECGRGLRQWQDTKPELESKLEELKAIAQMPLKLH